MGLSNLALFSTPEIATALEALTKAGAEAQRMLSGARAYDEQMKRLGIPPQFGSFTQAPFDMLTKLIDIVGKGGGFILDAAVGFDEAKPENVKAMFDFTKNMNCTQ